ncbi:neuroblast differentiation-associated protein AHNAK-like isoform X1 [Salvelinus sp. IW2-2015]|uniref:neuroblast differentiation-associated protein AHNAK-like isoform X1 n=2 Tax=Salvelinus sp. IW2-2015 TaxID=2691554 RepID=UPI000CDF70F0|nr:neuroblast differentiation-associated protein AHNAK-like isoform X1 [Salvelinus alpinus]
MYILLLWNIKPCKMKCLILEGVLLIKSHYKLIVKTHCTSLLFLLFLQVIVRTFFLICRCKYTSEIMNGESQQRRYSKSLVLEDSKRGVVITGITDPSVTDKIGLKEDNEIVAVTINLNHLSKDDRMKLLKIMEPYNDNMRVMTKQDLKASVSLGSLDGGLKDPGDMLKDPYSRMQQSVEAPTIEVDGLSGQLNAEGGLKSEINGPTLNGELPNVTLDTPGTDGDAKFTMSTIGMSRPIMKGADLDGTLRCLEDSLLIPKLRTPDASLDLEKPEVKTNGFKYKDPKLKMPHFNLPHIKAKAPKGHVNISGDLEGPGLSGELETPDLKISAPDVEIKAPNVNLNDPNADLKAPDVDIEAPSGKFKWLTQTKPKFGLSGTKVKGSDVDIDAGLFAADVNLSTLNIDGEISASDVDLSSPKAEVDLQAPDINIEAPSSKWKWPHLKKHKFGLHGPKVKAPGVKTDLETPTVDLSASKIEGEMSNPNLELNLPKADLSGPDVDIHPPIVKFKFPTLKKPKFRLSGPKIKAPDVDADLKVPDLSLSVPDVDAGLDTPDLDTNLSNADIKGPEVDFNAPEVDIEPPSGKFKWLTLKKPKFGHSGPKVKGLEVDIDADLSAPDLNHSTPNIGEISAPAVDLNLHKADLDAPDVDIDAPSGKFQLFNLKKPQFGLDGPKVKETEMDLDAKLTVHDMSLSTTNIYRDISAPDVDVNFPTADLKGPDVDLQAPEVNIEAPSGKHRFSTFKMPKVNWSGHKVKGPDLDVDLKTPDLDLSAIEGDIAVPDLNVSLPEADLKGPDVDVDIDAPSGKFKLPKIKWPKIRKVKGLELDVDADFNTPELDVDLPEAYLKGTDIDLKTADLNLLAPAIEGDIAVPDLNVSLPEIDLKGQVVDIQASDVNLEPSGKLKFPKIKLPNLGLTGPRVKGSNLDANLKALELDISVPDLDVNLPTAYLQAPVELKTPDLDLSAPQIEGAIAAPDLSISFPEADIKGPEVDLQALDADRNAPSGKFNLPKIKLPNFGLTGPRVKGPNLDANLKAPELDASVPDVYVNLSTADLQACVVELKTPDLSAHKIERAITAPCLDIHLSEVDLKAPDLNIEVPIIELKTHDSGISVPEIDVNLPKADIQGSDLDLNAPDLNLSAPKIEGDIAAPGINVSLPEAARNATDDQLQISELNLSTPKVEGDISAPDLDISLPKMDFEGLDVDLQAPNVYLNVDADPKTPDLDISALEVDVNLPKVDLKVHDLDLKTPELNVSASKLEGEVNVPEIDINVPKADLKGSEVDIKAPDIDTDAASGKFKFSYFKHPTFGLSNHKLEEPNLDVDAPDINILVPTLETGRVAPKVDVHQADRNLSAPNVESDISAPDVNLTLPKPDLSGPEVELNAPDLNLSTPEIRVSVPDIGLSVQGDIKSPEVELNSPDVDIEVPSGKLPYFKMPKFGLSRPRIKVPELDASADVNAPDVEVSVPKVEGEISTPELSLSAPDVNLADIKIDDTHKSKLKWQLKWPRFRFSGSKGKESDMDNEEEQSGDETESGQVEVPMFTFHRLPKNNKIESALKDAAEALFEAIDTPKLERGLDTASTEVSLPKVNVSLTEGRKETSPSGPINIMERLKLFKAKITSDALDSLDENNRISISLSNMLGLNITDPNADYSWFPAM